MYVIFKFKVNIFTYELANGIIQQTRDRLSGRVSCSREAIIPVILDSCVQPYQVILTETDLVGRVRTNSSEVAAYLKSKQRVTNSFNYTGGNCSCN